MVKESTISYLQKKKQVKRMRHSFWNIAVCLSLVIVLGVFWYLKLTGITLAGDAFCGVAEHTHTEVCYEEGNECALQEHTHIESCYSDITADLETADDWEMSFADVERGKTTAENMVLLAKSQLGYTESEKNFQVDSDGVRQGITRYGQWYGNPYGDWSTMFVMFCMEYAGVEDVPLNAGAESLRLEWAENGLFKSCEEYAPMVGNIVFLNKLSENEDITANAVGIIVDVTETEIKVIEGDVDSRVAETTYAINSNEILGYGLIAESSEFAVTLEAPKPTKSIAAVASFENSMLTSSNRFVLYTEYQGNTYAIDVTGNSALVLVENGKIFIDTDNPEMYLWTFSRYNNNSTSIQNVSTGRYLHPYYNSGSDNGITTPGRWGTTVSKSGSGVKFSHSAYIGFNSADGTFFMTRNQNENVTFNIGVSRPCTVWFDGTNGGLMGLGGSDDTKYSVYTDSTMTLPSSWKSPEKYDYVLKGWYDIINHKYYAPGDEVVVTGDMVFYADWKAKSYDVGKFNSQTTETVSTNSFITTRMFDYGALLNLLSENVDVTVNSNSHSETWRLLTSGKNPYNGNETFNFIFRDWDMVTEILLTFLH